MSKQIEVHIYTLSRLVHAPAGSWERKIEEIEQGRRQAYVYYGPMREAVVAFCASKGVGRDKIISRMLAKARHQPRGRGQNPDKDRLGGVRDLRGDLLSENRVVSPQSPEEVARGRRLSFEEILLRGAPHFKATNKSGATRYVFLHASRWADDDLKAYLELLGVIVEAEFNQPATSIWHMNLRTGLTSKHRPSKRMRSKCVDAARHYARLFAAA